MVLGSGKPGWYRRQSTRAKALMVAGTATGLLGIGTLVAGPAMADPGTTYLGGGSDTTEAIMDAFATTTNGLVGSYDAVDPVTGTTNDTISVFQNAGTGQTMRTFCRPNGSGDGVSALRFSNGSTTVTPYGSTCATGTMPVAGTMSFARSSSGPGSNQSPTGVYVYVPFAYDNVALAVGPTGTTNITQANLFTFADLQTLYKSCGTVTEGGVTYWPLGSPTAQPAGSQQIDLYIPQAGSGSRNFWLSTLTGSTTPAVCVTSTEDAGAAHPGQSLEENHGQVLTDDPDGVFPYSVGQWLYQQANSGTSIDVRAGALLTNLSGISPFGNPPTDTTMNVSTFPIFRELYNVFVFNSVAGTTPNPDLVRMFVNTTSALCQSAGIIRSFGFVSLASATQAPDACGSDASSLRAFATP
jgi:hypothetical protein